MALTSKNPAKQRQAEALEVEESRFVADIPKPTHRQIRVRCAELGIDQKAYFLGLVEKDLAKAKKDD
jgi:hypothetical protein